MDEAAKLLDPYVFDSLFATLPFPYGQHGHWVRQLLSAFLILTVGGWFMYLSGAGLAWLFIFDKNLRKEKRFLKNQEMREIALSLYSIPVMAIPSCVIFLGEMRGWSRLHEEPITGVIGWLSVAFQAVIFLAFTDMLVYWIHRGLHLPWFYVNIHKPHHKWIVTSPFSSHAFHPMDGFAQSLPYHIYAYLFPINKWVYIVLFIFVNYWTISIHDGFGMYSGQVLNGSDHHVIHHRQFNYNYGQYFTFWDRLCGTHRKPTNSNLFDAEAPKGVKHE